VWGKYALDCEGVSGIDFSVAPPPPSLSSARAYAAHALNVLSRDVALDPAEPPRVAANVFVEDVEDLPLPKLAAKEWRRRPAPGARTIRRPLHRNRGVDDAAHLPVDWNRAALHMYRRGMLGRRRQRVPRILELLIQSLAGNEGAPVRLHDGITAAVPLAGADGAA